MLIHLIPKWPPRREKKLVRVARKRGHKGQFGLNKNNEKLTSWHYEIITIFLCFQTCFLCHGIHTNNSTKTTLAPCGLTFVQLMPVFSMWRPFWNKVY